MARIVRVVGSEFSNHVVQRNARTDKPGSTKDQADIGTDELTLNGEKS